MSFLSCCWVIEFWNCKMHWQTYKLNLPEPRLSQFSFNSELSEIPAWSICHPSKWKLITSQGKIAGKYHPLHQQSSAVGWWQSPEGFNQWEPALGLFISPLWPPALSRRVYFIYASDKIAFTFAWVMSRTHLTFQVSWIRTSWSWQRCQMSSKYQAFLHLKEFMALYKPKPKKKSLPCFLDSVTFPGSSPTPLAIIIGWSSNTQAWTEWIAHLCKASHGLVKSLFKMDNTGQK